MSGQTPLLPSLPAGFGTDSSYPPIPGSTRITASQPKPLAAAVVASPVSPPRPHRPTGPPLPPLPPGALEQEQQRLRRQSASHSVTPSAISSGLRPGQLVHAPTPPPPPLPPPPQPTHHFVGGFASPHQQRSGTPVAAPRPPPPPPPPSMPTPSYGLANNMQAMSIHSHTQAPSSSSSARRASANDAFAATSTSRPSQPPSFAAPTSSPPSLSAPLPDMTSLATQRDRARDDRSLVSWAKQMLKYVERNFSDGTKISEPSLVKWTDEAISIITHNASSPRPEPEALYIRADLQASGAFPTYLAKNLKEAFNDFELSARMGWAPSWFRIGRDYEVLGDLARARDAYDRGVHARDVGCIYRMGMAHLLGQLELPVHHARAVAMLRDAADKADLDTPQPAYIFGMLLAGEFAHVDIPAQLLRPANTSAAALEDEARRRILRAAYLNFAPAQYKCGWLFEYAQLGCAFDPLLSVQYYSLASQGGETEADMALSKWFLCGAESYFEKNETLAYTFADKAARKGLASAEFALGYYHEVGVGTERNVDLARKWYNKAAAKDNADARERLHALQGPQALGLSRKQHEAVMDDKLVRKRTQAKMLSDREGHSPAVEYDQYIGSSSSGGGGGSGNGQRRPSGPAAATSNVPAARPAATSNKNHLELSRKRTMKMVEETAAGRRRPNYGSSAPPAMPNVPVAPQPRPAGRLPSGTHPSSTPGRHGKGYTLNDSAPASSAPSSHSAASHAPSSAGTTSASTGTDESAKRPYNTFAEMGFAPQKPKKEECVVC
ncbi:related to SKT5-protoplast regeneration and killer toxin resistance protein [Sporisorium reilianum SRZ2]|uniref:Related to SKT5-protoplast regeneration and killer toxin resistance protein n=1 Tax=Sporisorium reilianum (strain SRZ2) TaxID=999809 RepID=E7A235_SPORE|nr:related to SKT5-protoplast regeneration and killer toxin resistance protein [Sporisorium reilianum SRZ2]